jgi:lysophospholipase L1-like esterase
VAVALLAAALAAWVLNRADPGGARVWRLYTVPGGLVNLGLTWIALAGAYVLLPRSPGRRRGFRMVGITFAGGFVVVLLELPVLLLGFDYQPLLGTVGAGNWLQMSGTVNKADPELIHVHWPGSTYQGEVVGNLVQMGIADAKPYRVDVRYDHNGFRNDRDLERAEVAAIGDSFIEAAILPIEDGVVKQLEQRLDTDVVNLGQAAYGLKQELGVLRRFALPLRPRLVLWFLFGGNDLRDVETYEWQKRNLDSATGSPSLKERMFLRNGLLALSALTTPSFDDSAAGALSSSGVFRRADGVRERMYFGAGCGPWNEHQWKVATETLAEADRLTRAAGATFVVVYITRKFRIYRDHVELEPGSEASTWTVNDLPQVLGKWCGEQGIHYLDLTPRLAEAVARGEHPHLVDDVHWNARGHALAADAVVDFLDELGWRPEGR